MDTFRSKWRSKWILHMSAFFTLNLAFPPLQRNLDVLWNQSFLLFGVFAKWKKSNSCFNLCFVIHFVLNAFAVRHTAIVTSATTFSLFSLFPYFVWNFCCWKAFLHFDVFINLFSKIRQLGTDHVDNIYLLWIMLRCYDELCYDELCWITMNYDVTMNYVTMLIKMQFYMNRTWRELWKQPLGTILQKGPLQITRKFSEKMPVKDFIFL